MLDPAEELRRLDERYMRHALVEAQRALVSADPDDREPPQIIALPEGKLLLDAGRRDPQQSDDQPTSTPAGGRDLPASAAKPQDSSGSLPAPILPVCSTMKIVRPPPGAWVTSTGREYPLSTRERETLPEAAPTGAC